MEIALEIQDLSRNASGVGRDASGKVFFVPFSAPGDFLRVRVKEESKRYTEAQIVEVVRPSSHRIAPACPAFTQCGGCEWQHIPYELQWHHKVKGLQHTLARLGMELHHLTWTEFPAPRPLHYRNRIQLRGQREQVGFFARGSKTLVPIEKCWIAREELNHILPKVREQGAKLEREYKVELEVFPDGKTSMVWNARHSAQGFRQVFDEQNTALQDWVKNSLTGKGMLLDLYGGQGNLSLGLKERFAEIHCVDIGAPGTSTPSSSVLPSAPGMSIYSFHRSFVLPWLKKNLKTLKTSALPISVVLDPPREGLGEDLIPILEILKELRVHEILAVGCEPDPWAKLLHRALRHGCTLSALGALDFFPQTHHVEALAVLHYSNDVKTSTIEGFQP